MRVLLPETPSDLRRVIEARDGEEDSRTSAEDAADCLERVFRPVGAQPQFKGMGGPFLALWMRSATLLPLVGREFGAFPLHTWCDDGRSRVARLPLGLVGHWPAGNQAIQPLLSMSCAFLAGNPSVVRVPKALVGVFDELFSSLPDASLLSHRCAFVHFASDRIEMHRAMAECVDGAMIWGGIESVMTVRSLPFPESCRMQVFGPRVSASLMDRDSLLGPELADWVLRLTRDVFAFDQTACSSPHVLWVEAEGDELEQLLELLRAEFARHAETNPLALDAASVTSAVLATRARWLLDAPHRSAAFPLTGEWSVLLGSERDEVQPCGFRVLHVLSTSSLERVVQRLNRTTQTLGVAMTNPKREASLADMACRRGVDRVVKLGRMHVFGSPWDGRELVAPMTRLVRHIPASDGVG